MPFHLAANFVALADTANTDVPALNDDILARQSSHHIPSRDMRLLAVYSSAVTLLRTRLNSPKVRQVSPNFILPVGTTLLPISRPPVMDWRSRPFTLASQEEIIYESTDSAAGPNNHYVLSWLEWDPRPAPVGDPYILRGTSTTAGVASTWTTLTTTWDNTLPAGLYAVIGGQVQSATGIAFSIIFRDQYPRPGGLCFAGAGGVPWEAQVNGGLGEWGRFTTVTLPDVRILDNTTGNAHTIYLQCVRLG